ncbi:MAG: glycoside hydrolase family 5 protein [Muribaculaceae bacterium]|nr:glycoside hydrolase family 5 protein [Muribaculaceae bacterium]MDE6753205.1 glycoside hydrolase family 5 protein [Muribaculaceae bacterium]
MKRICKFVLCGIAFLALANIACVRKAPLPEEKDFLKVQGKDIVDSKGNKFYIKGTNLGNWLNPEGYMFGFSKVNSARMINEALCQLVGPTKAAQFWQSFKDNYITESDFRFIASEGANTVRVPFHYKLFTNEDYMGLNDAQEGFRRLDSCVSWAKRNNLRLILDMHDCPGGQTGDNIDDSYGYPWLLTDSVAQKQFINIWGEIARKYSDEDVILGYELANEPVATYWEGEERAYLNSELEPLYKRVVAEIRKSDPNHIILLGGPQWNSYFGNFTDSKFDGNIMYTCHRYGGDATPEAIRSYIEFRDSVGLPMYMGEIGHNTEEWMNNFVKVMRDNNIGYTFWPYKKIEDSSMTGVSTPAGWEKVVAFVEAPRSSYSQIREARSLCSQEEGEEMLRQFVENSRAEKMLKHEGYINAIDLKNENHK